MNVVYDVAVSMDSADAKSSSAPGKLRNERLGITYLVAFALFLVVTLRQNTRGCRGQKIPQPPNMCAVAKTFTRVLHQLRVGACESLRSLQVAFCNRTQYGEDSVKAVFQIVIVGDGGVLAQFLSDSTNGLFDPLVVRPWTLAQRSGLKMCLQ